MRIIALASGKGGVGKTTLTANLGIALAQFGFRTAVVDACFETPDLATHFGFIPKVSLWEVLTQRMPVEDAIYEHSSGLHIIPNSPALKKVEKRVYSKFRRTLRKLKYDFVLIDTPPGVGDDVREILLGVNEVLVIANPEWTAMSNAYKTLLLARSMKKEITGIVMNKETGHEYEPSRNLVEAMMGAQVLGFVPFDLNVQKALALKNPVVISFPETEASIAIKEIAGKISGVEYKPKRGLLAKIFELLGIKS